MMDPVRRLRQSEDVVRRLVAAIRSAQLYAPTHPLVLRSLDAFGEALTLLIADQPAIALGVIDGEIVVEDTPLPRGHEVFGEVSRRLTGLGIERMAFERGVTADALRSLVVTLAHPDRPLAAGRSVAEPIDLFEALQALPGIKVGRLTLDERIDTTAADMATIRRLYSDAVGMAGGLWQAAQQDGQPDPHEARRMVDHLAQAVAQNRTALVALTALKEYHDYTFTHMVNVSILTMAQARALGIEGELLREFGLAGLMHDIGKVRTPLEILNKPEALTDTEFAIMRLHVVDGAKILRRTPEMPALAPVVAFEHHLRLDGSGYPAGVSRPTLNLATMVCAIADAYDAMRSHRAYQQAFPTDRILAVLNRNNGAQFDPHLVRRFTQLMGIYPPGTLVRLDTNDVAVVLRVHAADSYRPRVRVIAHGDGQRRPQPYDINLWETDEASASPRSIAAPLDPAAMGLDPLTYL